MEHRGLFHLIHHSSKTMYRCLLIVTFLESLLCGYSRGQLATVNMQEATDRLGERFEQIRQYGLGIDVLEAEYNRVGFTFSALEQLDINTLLSNDTAQQRITSVLSLFEGIASGTSNSSGSFVIPPTTECCSIDLSGQSNPQACCHLCSNITINTTQLTTMAGAYRDADLSGVELEFGFAEGPLLKFPAVEPGESCEQVDARLQPWYIDATRLRPREIVLLLDLSKFTNPAVTADDIRPLRSAAQDVLYSLTSQDKVGVVLFGSSVRVAPLNSQIGGQVVPVCPTNQDALSSFISSVTTIPHPGNYTPAFQQAISLFTNDSSTDKLLLFFTLGHNSYFDAIVQMMDPTNFTFQTILDAVTVANGMRGNNVVISVYKTQSGTPAFLNQLIQQPMPGNIMTLGTVGDYYSLLLNSSLVMELKVNHQNNGQGENSLSISRVLLNGDSLVGVFHAVLPWRHVFGHIEPSLVNRNSSYFFVMSGSGRVLYHPLLPGDSQSDLLVTDVETDANMTVVLEMLRSQPSVTYQSPNVLLVPTGTDDLSSFIQQSVFSTYHCRDLGISGLDIYACLVLAEENVNTVSLLSVDPSVIYSSNSSRQPIYHNTSLSVPEEDQCNYFCKVSTTDQISFQLTGLSQPPEDDTPALFNTITQYIEGTGGTRPEWVEEGVASEVAINSIVASTWLDQTGGVRDYIIRRHLITPSGVYLTFPPVQLPREFHPMRTEWYTLSAPHKGALTITTPRLLDEGLVYSVGYTLRAPGEESDLDLSDGGHVLSVVAADISFASLETFLADALPLCKQNDISCFIIDDRGNLVYHPTFLEDNYNGGSVFFSKSDLPEHRPILSDLLSKGLATKLQCVDYFIGDIKQRLFYSLNLSSEVTYSNLDDSGNCVEYMLRHIPGTNTFFAVVKVVGDCLTLFCFCSMECFNCNMFQPFGCECPCTCSEDCVQPRGIPPCPSTTREDPNPPTDLLRTTPLPSFCFIKSCGSREDFESCAGIRECSWCGEEKKCVHISECCNPQQNGSCCSQQPQADRFSTLPECIFLACKSGDLLPSPTVPSSSDSDDDNTAIYAGVAGGVVGLALLSVLILFILWYQFCKAADLDEENSRESAFDFTTKRMESTNPNTISPAREPEEVDTEMKKQPEKTTSELDNQDIVKASNETAI